MLRKLRPRSAYDVMAAIALFIALAGGTAYAANTIGSSDVIDDSLTSSDIHGHAASPGQSKINGTLTTDDIRDRTLIRGDIANDTLSAAELGPNSASTSEIKDGSVTESKLAPAEAWQNVKDPDPSDTDHSDCNASSSVGY